MNRASEIVTTKADPVWNPDADPVELDYLPDDFTQAHDLAADHSEKVAELKALFWGEAERYQVLPLGAACSMFFGIRAPLPPRTRYEFRGDVQNVLPGMISCLIGRSYRITAELQIPDEGAEGVIVAEADHLGGFSLFVQNGILRHTYSMMGVQVFRQQAAQPLATGDVTVEMAFLADSARARGRRSGHALGQRHRGRRRTNPTHRPAAIHRLRRHGRRPRQRRRCRTRLRQQGPVPIHRQDQQGHLRPRTPLRPNRRNRRATPRRPQRTRQRHRRLTADDNAPTQTTDHSAHLPPCVSLRHRAPTRRRRCWYVAHAAVSLRLAL